MKAQQQQWQNARFWRHNCFHLNWHESTKTVKLVISVSFFLVSGMARARLRLELRKTMIIIEVVGVSMVTVWRCVECWDVFVCLWDCQQTEHCRGATEGSITVTGSHVVDTSLLDTLHFISSWLLVIADSGGETVASTPAQPAHCPTVV